MTDISDVVVVNNPFEHPFFIENPGTIFCGDEPKILENDWMIDHSAHFRQKIADYSNYENIKFRWLFFVRVLLKFQ